MSDGQRFEDDLDRWGGDLSRWPLEARRGAEALLAASPAARALHASMIEMERALALPSAAVLVDYAAVATLQPQQRPLAARRGPPALRRAGWGAAIAAALVLGVVVGDFGPAPRDESPDQVLASALGPATGTVDVD